MGSCRYTYRLMAELAEAQRKQALATLVTPYQLGYKLVESLILKAGEAKLTRRQQAPLVVKPLDIDEISRYKGQGPYMLVLTALERRIVVDLLPARRKKSLMAGLAKPPAGIDLALLETVAIDLWSQCREAAQSIYPTGPIVAERFHVVQNLNEAIHAMRWQAQATATSEEAQKSLKGLRYRLLKNKKKLGVADRERLKKLAATQPDLYQLCEVRQELHDGYETLAKPEEATVSLDKATQSQMA